MNPRARLPRLLTFSLRFKSHVSATEAIRRFDGVYDGRFLKVAPYRKRTESNYWNGSNRNRGDSLGGSQRYVNDYTGDLIETSEQTRTNRNTGRDRNVSVSTNGVQMPRKEPNTPSKRFSTPSKHDLVIKRPHTEIGTTPRGGKGHQSTGSGQSTKSMKSVDASKLR